jgi:uncharacterized protein YukE
VSRPADWSPLADADPVPGDAAQVAILARRYADTATAIRAAAAALDQIHAVGGGWESEAGRAFNGKTKEVAGSIRQALERYEQSAAALNDYAQALDAVQGDARDLLAKAKQAETDRQGAERKAAAAADPTSPTHGDLGRLEGAAEEASQRLGAIRAQLAGLVERWHAAGDTAASAIHHVTERDGLKDSGWANFLGGLTTIANWAGALAATFGMLALVCALIPLLQPLAALFTALAFVCSVASLICNGLLYANDRATLSDVVWDLVGVVTFGAGRAFTAAARSVANGARAMAKTQFVATLRAGRMTRAAARATAREYRLHTLSRGLTHRRALAARAGSRSSFWPTTDEWVGGLSGRGVFRDACADLAPRGSRPLSSRAALDIARDLPVAVKAVPAVKVAIRNANIASGAAFGLAAVSNAADLRQLGVPLPLLGKDQQIVGSNDS